MVLMGIPDDLDPQNLHEGWYFWTNVKPRRRLASMLPPTLESLYLNSQFAILCDHTDFFFGTSSTIWLRYRFFAYLGAEVALSKPSSNYQQPSRSSGLS
jgi:hypothetical protein